MKIYQNQLIITILIVDPTHVITMAFQKKHNIINCKDSDQFISNKRCILRLFLAAVNTLHCILWRLIELPNVIMSDSHSCYVFTCNITTSQYSRPPTRRTHAHTHIHVHTRTHVRTYAHARTHTHTRTHARTHAHTH